MLELHSLVSLAVQGLRSKLFGLACPFYCQGASVSVALAAFLSGLILGVFLCGWLILRFDLFPSVAAPLDSPSSRSASHPSRPQGRARSALISYLHEPRRRL